MGLSPASQESTATNPWRMRYGFVGYFAVTWILWVIACNPFFLKGCSEGNPLLAAWCAGIMELALIAILFAGRGSWRFTVGFFIAFLGAATFTRGRATAVWLVPASVALGVASPIWSPLVARQKAADAQNEWAGVHRTQHPSVVHATRLANLVHECALTSLLHSPPGGFPRTADELVAAPNCGQLRDLALDAAGVKGRFGDADNGWRWSYSPGLPNAEGFVSEFAMRVVEDPILGRPAPQFSGDETGTVREEQSGTPPRFVASPVASLVTLRRCLTRIPAENARLAAERGWPSGSPALHMVGSVCPELHHHIGIPYSGDSDGSGTLAVQVHDQAGEFTDTAAVYRTEFVPADVDGMIFEVHAIPIRVSNGAIHSGVRHFFVARDGSVHATADDRHATIGDPIAAECLPGGGVDCSVAEATVTQAAGPGVHPAGASRPSP